MHGHDFLDTQYYLASHEMGGAAGGALPGLDVTAVAVPAAHTRAHFVPMVPVLGILKGLLI